MSKESAEDILRWLQELPSDFEVLRCGFDEIRPRASSLYQASLLLRDETGQLSTEDIAALYKALVVNCERLNTTLEAMRQFIVLRREEQSKK